MTRLIVSVTYADWIARHAWPAGACADATAALVAAFPELRRVRGHVILAGTAKHPPHWWCVAPDGAIVDPTAAQFPTLIAYDEWIEGAEEPVGKCAECGGYIYASSGYSSTVCSEACATAYTAYLLTEAR